MNCCDEYGKCKGGHGCPVGDADSIAASSVPVDFYGRPTTYEKSEEMFAFGDKLVLWGSVVIFVLIVVASIWDRAMFGMWGGL